MNVLVAMRKRRGEAQRPTVVTYNSLIELSLRHGHPETALEALRAFLIDGKASAEASCVKVRPDRNTFEALVTDWSNENPTRRLRFLIDALNVLREHGRYGSSVMYKNMLRAAMKGRDEESALQLMSQRNIAFRVAARDAADIDDLERRMRRAFSKAGPSFLEKQRAPSK
mmetsp:Transcript_378/g.946  ORF Transcript_378/g.946 Transcript_378/m.946 type:complete len:170 (+) Transcript_378:1-510(+)